VTPPPRDARFVAFLLSLAAAEDKAALAALLRGLGKPPGAAPEMLRWLSPWTRSLGLREAGIRLQVASLFALHPSHVTQGNVGSTCAALRELHGASPSLEQRFVALLNCRIEALSGHLRRLIGLAEQAGIAVNWAQLLTDLRYWDHPERFVQLAWAHAFWGSEGQSPTAPPTSSATSLMETTGHR
jgi:CRISPR system Cascade subunit CasB